MRFMKFHLSLAVILVFCFASCETEEPPPPRHHHHQASAATTQPPEQQPFEQEYQPPPPPANVTSETPTPAPAASVKPTRGDIPYGIPVPNKPGFVTSPYAPNQGYVDVRGFPPGTEVKDPYTNKIFLVP
jgi:hypothetical protein